MRILETCTILAEKEFEKLEDQSNYNKRVSPLKYIGRLILFVLTSLVGTLIMFVLIVDFVQDFGDENLYIDQRHFVDNLGEIVNERDEANEGTGTMILSVFTCLLFIFTNLYFIWATYHGNKSIG